jgi:hypothetical protein
MGSIRTFQEDVVVGVGGYVQSPGWDHGEAVVLYELEQLLLSSLANPQLRAPKHLTVFLQDGAGHVEARWFGDRE